MTRELCRCPASGVFDLKRVVVAEPIHADGLGLLRARDDLDLIAFDAPADWDALQDAAREAAAILVRTLPLPSDILAAAPKLEIVSKHGVGCDNIDVMHCTGRRIPVAIAADANATSVAEHTLMLMLACAKRLPTQEAAARAADWSFRQRVPAFELNGKTVLVVGMGRIGRKVAMLCGAFGMHVRGFDPAAQIGTYEGTNDLDEAIPEADVITIHTPLTDETRSIINADRLARMKPDSVLINCARGGVVDEAALLGSLADGPVAMYGADVFETEPVVADDPLFALPNVIATAHTGAMTAESKRAMAIQSAENILAHLDGTLDPRVVINRAELGR